MMWQVDGWRKVDTPFSSFEPEEVLYEFDIPRIFSVRDDSGYLALAYWCDESDQFDRYLVVPTSDRIVRGLKSGYFSVLDGLNHPIGWIVDIGFDGDTIACFHVEVDKIPENCLPKRGTMLWPKLEPLLTLRATGSAIIPGQIPGSVIRYCVEGPQKAMKLLSEFVLEGKSLQGKPSERIRRLFDLPTQRVAFASFEIAFGLPEATPTLFDDLEENEVTTALRDVQDLIHNGLEWIVEPGVEDKLVQDGPEKWEVILRALKELTPSTNSQIDKLEIGGRLTGQRKQPFVVDSESRRKVNNALRQHKLEPEVVELTGRVRELDKDRLSFELREVDGEDVNYRCSFEEDLMEPIQEALTQDREVRVVTLKPRAKGTAEALAVLNPLGGPRAFSGDVDVHQISEVDDRQEKMSE